MGNWVAARFIEAVRAHEPTGDIPPLEGLDDLDRRRDAEVCTCDHDIWVHAAQAPQWCTVKGCRCPTLFTKAQMADLARVPAASRKER